MTNRNDRTAPEPRNAQCDAALRVLVRLLARAAARELLAASQRQPAASSDRQEDA